MSLELKQFFRLGLILGACSMCFASAAQAQLIGRDNVVVIQNARILVGDGSVIENGNLEIRDGVITQLSGADIAAASAVSVIDGTGKTLIPALIDGHSHLGYQGRNSWGSDNYSYENLVDNLEQYAFYGFSAVFSAGSDAPNIVDAVEAARNNGEFTGAQLLYAAGMAPPGQGPNDLFLGHALAVEQRAGETILYGLENPEQAREQVEIAADKGIRFIKIWVDDRGGSQLKLSSDIYRAVIEEANLRNLKVFVHQQFAADMTDLIAAGVHGFLHGRIGADLGEDIARAAAAAEAFIVPNWGLGELRREAVGEDEFLNQIFNDSATANLLAGSGNRQSQVIHNSVIENELSTSFQILLNAGVDIVLGTDAGAVPDHHFGYTGHRELEIYVRLGMTPMQAIIAATSNAARHLGLENRGRLQVGMSADLILLSANPLDEIRNTRTIERVILNGVEVDRESLRRKWN